MVADDHPIVRKGLCQVIEEQPDLKVVGEVGDGVTALALIQSLKPRVAIVDLDMPRLDGFGVALEIRKLQLPSRSDLPDDAQRSGSPAAGHGLGQRFRG